MQECTKEERFQSMKSPESLFQKWTERKVKCTAAKFCNFTRDHLHAAGREGAHRHRPRRTAGTPSWASLPACRARVLRDLPRIAAESCKKRIDVRKRAAVNKRRNVHILYRFVFVCTRNNFVYYYLTNNEHLEQEILFAGHTCTRHLRALLLLCSIFLKAFPIKASP